MGIKTIKVLRTVSKIVLLVIILGLLGWGGYYVYRSIAFKPQNIVVTNITDSSATITWTTSSQMNGVVYYRKDKSVLPGPLGIIGSQIAYDDRDVSDAQTACVNEFNKNASETKDENFSVSGENFYCESARVPGMGKYYTHSVTIKNLEPESRYYFAMGDGIWSFKSDVSSVNTFALLEEVAEPMPVFGRVIGDDGSYSRDGLVYITFNDGSEDKDSVLYSSTTSDDGGWYLDASSTRDADGNVVDLELANDAFEVSATYSNYGASEKILYVLGFFNIPYPDIVVTKSDPLSTSAFWSKFVLGAFAECTYENVNAAAHGGELDSSCDLNNLTEEDIKDLGYGNVIRLQTEIHDGDVSAGLEAAKVDVNAGNMNAVYGTSVQGDIDGYNVSGSTDTVHSSQAITICKNGMKCDSSGNNCVTDADCGVEYKDSCTPKICTYFEEEEVYRMCIGGVTKDYANDDSNCDGLPDSSTSSAEGSEVLGPDELSNTQCSITKWDNGCKINCGTSASENVTLHAAWKCQAVYTGYDEMKDTDKISVLASVLKPWILSVDRIEILVNESTYVQELAQTELEKCESEHPRVDLVGDNNSRGDQCEKICKAMGWIPRTDISTSPHTFEQCDESHALLKLRDSLTSRTYALNSSEDNTYGFYLPEAGLYSFEIDEGQVTTSNTNGTDVQMFYIEANGKEGFQPPADFDNPTADEDIVLSENAYQISYEQETTAQQYNIAEGINIVSFNFVPTSTDSGAYMASDVIAQAKTNSVDIKYISTFDGGRWYEAYSCTSDTCTGTDFSIVPGRGYLIYATTEGDITIPGYNLKSSIPVAFSSGWNLVGIHGYTTAYTARTLIDSINTIDGLTANNVSWWPTSKGKYEGLQVENSTEYGLDFAISPTNGYFVRISEFAPSDTTCKSILWNDGGTLNGTCGNTK